MVKMAMRHVHSRNQAGEVQSIEKMTLLPPMGLRSAGQKAAGPSWQCILLHFSFRDCSSSAGFINSILCWLPPSLVLPTGVSETAAYAKIKTI